MTKVTIDRTFFPECVKALDALAKIGPVRGHAVTDIRINAIGALCFSLIGGDVVCNIALSPPDRDFKNGRITMRICVWFTTGASRAYSVYLFENGFTEFPTKISPTTIPKSTAFKIRTAEQKALIKDVFAQNKKNLNAAYLATVQAIQKGLSAQSKEDFYDDASDYQDDEPTDFGDASNYDEGLVRRIKEILE